MDPRIARLHEPHVQPLTALIECWRAEGFQVPNVDPNDGGVEARALFLLESPGPKAVASGFISRDNPDPSARNMGDALDQAGFARSDVVLWNVVPYCVSTVDQNRNAGTAEIIAAAPYTQAWVNALPDLRVAVFCGRKAQRAARLLRFRAGTVALKTFHPGGQSYNHARLREHIHLTFQAAWCSCTGSGQAPALPQPIKGG